MRRTTFAAKSDRSHAAAVPHHGHEKKSPRTEAQNISRTRKINSGFQSTLWLRDSAAARRFSPRSFRFLATARTFADVGHTGAPLEAARLRVSIGLWSLACGDHIRRLHRFAVWARTDAKRRKSCTRLRQTAQPQTIDTACLVTASIRVQRWSEDLRLDTDACEQGSSFRRRTVEAAS